MKRTITISLLVLAIVSSVLAGTLANYTTSIDTLAYGSAVGKEFIFVEDGMDTFGQGIKIAPDETVVWQFAVKNFDGNTLTETDLYYQLAFDVHATEDKQAIAPLTVTVKDENGKAIDTLSGTGTLTATGSFPLSNKGQSDAYTLEIHWPKGDSDNDFAGHEYGTSINVSASASQLAMGDQDEPTSGGDQTATSGVKVVYRTEEPWTEGAVWDPKTSSMTDGIQKHNFTVTIYNNTDEQIRDWSQMEFVLNEDIYNCWNARLADENSDTGEYRIASLGYNKTISANGSIRFEGQAIGDGLTPIASVTVNGESVQVECIYYTN